MDKYFYLLLSLFLLFIWLLIFLIRKDLKEKIFKTSIVGGIAGLLAEFWYFRDYWQPSSVLGDATISIEDFLFGFFITGIAATIYDLILKTKDVEEFKERKKVFILFFISGLISLLLFNNWLGFNSIFVSSFAFFFLSAIMVFIRKDLFEPWITSGLIMLILAMILYLLLGMITPNYWEKYWLLYNTKLGIMFLGIIPMTELIWYFSWGCLAGISYEFVTGCKKVKSINAKGK